MSGRGILLILGGLVATGGIALTAGPWAWTMTDSDSGICTLVGCDSGISVSALDIAYARPDVARVRVCIDNRCQEIPRSIEDELHLRRRVPGMRPVQVDAALLSASGATLARDRRSITRTGTTPNGQRCGPICWVGTVQIAPSGRLKRQPRWLPRDGRRVRADVIVRGRVHRLSTSPSRPVTPIRLRRTDGIQIRTGARGYPRVYVPGHLTRPEPAPFELAHDESGRIWSADVPRRLRGTRALMIRITHRPDRRVVDLRLPIELVD